MLTPISRAEAKERLDVLFEEQRERLDERFKGNFVIPTSRWDRVRNYEIEMTMVEWFGGEWVVSEWCPFNGVWCNWVHYAPEDFMLAEIESAEQSVSLDPEYEGVARYLREMLEKRKTPATD